MKTSKTFLPYLLIFTGLILFITLLFQPFSVVQFKDYISVLFPKGQIAVEQRNLLLIIQALMLLVVIPVYILTFVFSWRYRANGKKENYDPDLVDSTLAEVIWWGFPLVMTAIVGVLMWVKTVELDPYKPIASDQKPLTVEVVALQWKWLFIYPEEQIATLNFFNVPVDRPIRFLITADAPMNSFWIPDLGGQIYAMPAMRTELNLIANETGNFPGYSANISGEGFADMRFVVHSTSPEDYEAWLMTAKQSSDQLTLEEYNQLAKPSTNLPSKTYQLAEIGLFNQIMMKYMHPPKDNVDVR